MASKLWYGEEWYMQIDAHMMFAQDFDEEIAEDEVLSEVIY